MENNNNKHLYIPNHAKWVNFYENSLKRKQSSFLNGYNNSDGRVLTLSADSVVPIEKKELPKISEDKTDIHLITPSEQTTQQAVSQLENMEKKNIKKAFYETKRRSRKKSIKRSGARRGDRKRSKAKKGKRKDSKKNIFV